MSKKIDFIYSSARIRGLELQFIDHDKAERMLLSENTEEAHKILINCGYSDINITTNEDIEKLIIEKQHEQFDIFDKVSPDKNLIDIIKIKYDYHNIKVIIKSVENDNKHLFIESGRYNTVMLADIIRESDLNKLNPIMSQAIIETKDILAKTKNPQLVDFTLDKACFTEMLNTAIKTESKFIIEYVRLLIDINNLRAYVRSSRIHKKSDFLKFAVFEGGHVDHIKLITAIDNDGKLESIYEFTELNEIAKIGALVISGDNNLTSFEKECDNYIIKYLKKARYISYGEEPVFAYYVAKEFEYAAVRTILSGKLSNIRSDIIRERLREFYA